MNFPRLCRHYKWCTTVITMIILLGLVYLWSSSHKMVGAGVKREQEADDFVNMLETNITKLEHSDGAKANAQTTRNEPPTLTHHMLGPGNITWIGSYHQATASIDAKGMDTKAPETSITKLEDSKEMKAEARSEPVPTLTHHMLGPGNEQYATYINNLQMCLDAINLTDYFHREKFLSTAVANLKYYLDIVHKFIPHEFNATLPNHCWNDDAKLVIGSSYFSGHTGRVKYKIRRSGIDNNRYTMLSVIREQKNYTKEYFVPLSCIPEFFLAGFPKCGTSNMHALLTSHPAIYKTIVKEPSWWDKSEHFTNNTLKNALYMADYLVSYQSLVEKLSVTGSQNPVYSVDASTTTIYRFPKFPNRRIIDVCLLPSVIPEVLPKVKFIVMLRNPVRQLYSHFWYSCSRVYRKQLPLEVASKGPDIFHDRVLKRIASFRSCIARFPLAKCAQITEDPRSYSGIMSNCGNIHLSIALYVVHIQKWLSVVPRNRWLFVVTEELSTNKIQTLNGVWDFLNIPRLKEEVQENKYPQAFVDYHNKQSLFMRNDTREILKEFFRPYNQMLADFLGNRKFLFEDSYIFV